MDENGLETVKRWLSDPTTWVGVFENSDLSHRDVGRRTAIPYDVKDWDKATIGKDRAPDFIRTHGMLPWQYILVAKCRTLDEVKEAMKEKS